MEQQIQQLWENNIWNNIFILALIKALMIPICVFLLGLLIEFISQIIIQMLALFVGSHSAWLIVNRVLFIGTVHHELAHALFAFLTGAKVTRIVPIRFHGKELGQVDFIPRGNILFRSLQQTMSAVAPVVCGCGTLSMLYFGILPFCTLAWQQIIVYVVGISILLHMNMSGQDIKVAWKGLPVCILILFLIFLGVGVFIDK